MEALKPILPLVNYQLHCSSVLPLMLIGGYMVGWWIGIRSAGRGIAVVPMSAAVSRRYYLRSLDYYLLPEHPFALAQTAMMNFGIFSLSGLVRILARTASKLSRYMQYCS